LQLHTSVVWTGFVPMCTTSKIEPVARLMADYIDGTDGSLRAPVILQVAFTLPSSPDARVHIRSTSSTYSTVVLLASSSIMNPGATASLSTLVYALPNVFLSAWCRLKLASQSSTDICSGLLQKSYLSALPFTPRLPRLISPHDWPRP